MKDSITKKTMKGLAGIVVAAGLATGCASNPVSHYSQHASYRDAYVPARTTTEDAQGDILSQVDAACRTGYRRIEEPLTCEKGSDVYVPARTTTEDAQGNIISQVDAACRAGYTTKPARTLCESLSTTATTQEAEPATTMSESCPEGTYTLVSPVHVMQNGRMTAIGSRSCVPPGGATYFPSQPFSQGQPHYHGTRAVEGGLDRTKIKHVEDPQQQGQGPQPRSTQPRRPIIIP